MKKLSGIILHSRFGWLIGLVVVALLNIAGSAFHARFDLTREKRYTLSTGTSGLLRNLDDEMEVQVFLKGEFPAGFRKLANTVDEFLQIMKDQQAGKFSYKFISPEELVPGTSTRYADSLISMGVTPINLTVQVKAGQEQKYLYPVALITYQGKTRMVNLYPGASRYITQIEINNAEALLEFQFLKTMDELVSTKKAVVGYATGNGEPVDYHVFDLQQAIREKYDLFQFNLAEQKVIPPDFNAFVIVKPSLTFSDEEKLKIDQYLMRGGHVLIFLDRLYAENDSLRSKEFVAFDRNLNLTDLLFQYGARINPDLMMDLKCDVLPVVVGGTQENPQLEFLPWNYYPIFESQSSHLINKGLGPVVGRFVNSVDTISTPGIKKTVLLSSSPNSRSISTPALISLNENKMTPEDAAFKKSAIPGAVLLEGGFTSFFRNRISRVSQDSLTAQGFPFRETADPGSKLIVVGDGDMVMNDMYVKNGNPQPLSMGWNKYTFDAYQNESEASRFFVPFSNRSFLQNCLEYFTNKPAIIETGNKEIVLRLLDGHKVQQEKLRWQLISTGLPIVLVILAGLIYQQVRKKKYAVSRIHKQDANPA